MYNMSVVIAVQHVHDWHQEGRNLYKFLPANLEFHGRSAGQWDQSLVFLDIGPVIFHRKNEGMYTQSTSPIDFMGFLVSCHGPTIDPYTLHQGSKIQ